MLNMLHFDLCCTLLLACFLYGLASLQGRESGKRIGVLIVHTSLEQHWRRVFHCADETMYVQTAGFCLGYWPAGWSTS